MPREEFAGRFTTVYFDTVEEKQYWETVAGEYGISLSKLVFEGLELLRKRKETSPRPDLLRENEVLKEELAKVRRELVLQAGLIEKYESELYKVRHARFQLVDPVEEESRRFDLDLIALLKSSRKTLDSGAILAILKVDPRDLEATRLVRNQLDALQRHGLVAENSHGWRWKK